MRDDEEPKKKIIQLMKDTAPKKRSPRKPSSPRAGSNVFNISGNGNITAGGDVHYHQNTSPTPKPKVRPGIEHITPEHRKILTRLVREIAETEARLRKQPRGFAAVYSALFRQFEHVSKLEQIPLEGFDAARAYLNQQLGQLNAMPSAPVKNADAWRKKMPTSRSTLRKPKMLRRSTDTSCATSRLKA